MGGNSFRKKVIGIVDLPTGRLRVSDMYDWDLTHLARPVPPGSYPVEIVEEKDGWNLAARVRFSDAPVKRWEPAFFEGDKPEDYGEDKLPAIGSITAE